jgi:hypothetical protein
MELEQQLKAEISELQNLISPNNKQNTPKHLIKMYQSLIKTKKEKLKQLLVFS